MAARITSYTHDGLVLDVRDTGPLDGEPAVLLHGFPERGSSWDAVAPLLHERGIRTIVPDQRGYSPGARPRRRRDYRLACLAGDVEALAAEVGRPVHLVGHDWGASVAWLVAARSPGQVRSLTAVSVPPAMAFVRSLVTSDQLLRSWYMLLFQLPRVPELLAARSGGRFDKGLRAAGMTEGEVARCHREIVEYGALRGGLGWYRAMFLPGPGRPSNRVRVPTTLVWSDGDTAIGPRAAGLAAAYVDADYSLEVLEGVSHWIPTQAPDRLAAVIAARIASVEEHT
ncbi:alpha/beta fold hydrolase [Nocardioides ungokensis]|uniref:alpha/beta fold hydrolase n=1 Tax=Nocardioides ungokensis TaxID=1643322 RepID=UPI001C60BBDF|nr:alpha/beta fold hydrolase [Nocardioides ungokensis]